MTCMVSQIESNNFFKKNVTHVRVPLIVELCGQWLGYFTPVTDRSHSILEDFVKFSEYKEVSMKSLDATGYDGTNVITGTNGGLKVCMEQYLHKQHHWVILR